MHATSFERQEGGEVRAREKGEEGGGGRLSVLAVCTYTGVRVLSAVSAKPATVSPFE